MNMVFSQQVNQMARLSMQKYEVNLAFKQITWKSLNKWLILSANDRNNNNNKSRLFASDNMAHRRRVATFLANINAFNAIYFTAQAE